MYQLRYDRRIDKDLRSVPPVVLPMLLKKIEQLAAAPRRMGVEKLEFISGYRLRVGDYRVLFDIDDTRKIVTVYRIKHRREAYR